MSLTLEKGSRVTLEKGGQNLEKIMVGLGWDPIAKKRLFGSAAFDLDASVFEVANGDVIDTIYFGNLNSWDRAVRHMGDNLTGEGDGDDEQILVELAKIPENVDKLVFVVNIYDGRARKQHFGMVNNAYIRLINNVTGEEFCKYNLSGDYDKKTAMVMGEVYRHNGAWKMRAIGEGTLDQDLASMKLSIEKRR